MKQTRINRWAGCVLIATMVVAGPREAPGQEEAGPEDGEKSRAPVLSDSEEHPFLFSIPAPRGRILDRNGATLANSRVVHRATLAIPVSPDETAASFVSAVHARVSALHEAVPELVAPSEKALREHHEHRRLLPVPLGDVISAEGLEAAKALEGDARKNLRLQPLWVRNYPAGKTAAHVVGYVTRTGSPLRGPLHEGELLWPAAEGRSGLEAQFEDDLKGTPGTLSVTLKESGEVVREELALAAKPGLDVVSSLDLRLQRVADKALGSVEWPGALVVLDPVKGDILAMASTPGFDPGQFVPSISRKEFSELEENPEKPLYNRAVSGEYPPGSIFKPMVALAALDRGPVSTYTTYQVGPYLEIEGRRFHNWSDEDTGRYDLRSALIRSQNTWFFQAAIATGDGSILWAASQLGFGLRPAIDLAGAASGNLPAKVRSNRGLANLSIGQGEVLATPLQAALAMAGIANGNYVPKPRLVLQTQGEGAAILRSHRPARGHVLSFYENSLRAVHAGMAGVVNHPRGTANPARVDSVTVLGKTGTAQWSAGGEGASAVWFSGFVKESDPALAFAVVLEGGPGERIFGGSHASPVVGQFLQTVFSAPADYGVSLRERRSRPAVPAWETLSSPRERESQPQPESAPRAIPLADARQPVPPIAEPDPQPRSRPTPAPRAAPAPEAIPNAVPVAELRRSGNPEPESQPESQPEPAPEPAVIPRAIPVAPPEQPEPPPAPRALPYIPGNVR
ncbi:hypothetical protein BH23VER1_BH23VER1_23440 [soil metagenome]